MKLSRTLASALVALALVFASLPAFAAAFESDASFSDCVACDNGTVELIMDGGSAIVRDLTFDDDSGKWVGVGSVIYSGQGLSINDVGVHFEVVIQARPVICDPRATKMAVSIRAVGSAAGFVLTSSNFHYDTEPVTCWSRGLIDVTIDDHPKSVGKLKHLYRSDSKTQITPSGRALKV